MSNGKRVKKREGSSAAVTVTVVVATVAAILVVGFFGLGAYVSGLDTIYPNVTVCGQNVGGLTSDSAETFLTSSGVGVPSGVEATVELTGKVSLTVTSDEVGIAVSPADAAEAAYAYGRDGGFFAKIFSFVDCVFNPHEAYIQGAFNEKSVRDSISAAAERANHPEVASEYTVTQSQLLMTRGGAAFSVDEEGVFRFIRDTLLSGKSASTSEFSEAETVDKPVNGLDFDAIYDEIYVEPVDAVYDPETQTGQGGVYGVSFDRDAARTAFERADPGETVALDLIITPPAVTAGQIDDLLFADKLAEKTTTLSTSSANRINNIRLTAEAINGLVMNPGDVFSFNGVVGERTSEKGYKPAGAFANGTTVDEVGGGICQTSSTLYFCTLKADLEIVDRECHGMPIAYIEPGFDATVYWPSQDFKFSNNRSYPIKLVAYVDENGLTVEIWGTKESDVTVMLEYTITEYLEPSVRYVEDDTLAPGEEKVRSYGAYGYRSEAYKLYYDGNGELIKREFLSRDTYIAQTKVIARGPTPASETPGTSEAPSESETPGTPEAPSESETPGTPEAPSEGETSGTPETPSESETPETPGASENPGEPQDGDDPGTDITTPQG